MWTTFLPSTIRSNWGARWAATCTYHGVEIFWLLHHSNTTWSWNLKRAAAPWANERPTVQTLWPFGWRHELEIRVCKGTCCDLFFCLIAVRQPKFTWFYLEHKHDIETRLSLAKKLLTCEHVQDRMCKLTPLRWSEEFGPSNTVMWNALQPCAIRLPWDSRTGMSNHSHTLILLYAENWNVLLYSQVHLCRFCLVRLFVYQLLLVIHNGGHLFIGCFQTLSIVICGLSDQLDCDSLHEPV